MIKYVFKVGQKCPKSCKLNFNGKESQWLKAMNNVIIFPKNLMKSSIL